MGKSSSKPMLNDEKIKRFIGIGDVANIVELFDQDPLSITRPLNNNLWTPLLYACIEQQVEVIEFLVENYNIDLDVTDSDGMTALHLSVYQKSSRSLHIIHYLCQKGANPLQRTLSGVTPRGLAFAMQNPNAQKALEFYETHGLWARMPWKARKALIWVHERSEVLNIPFCLVKDICFFM